MADHYDDNELDWRSVTGGWRANVEWTPHTTYLQYVLLVCYDSGDTVISLLLQPLQKYKYNEIMAVLVKYYCSSSSSSRLDIGY